MAGRYRGERVSYGSDTPLVVEGQQSISTEEIMDLLLTLDESVQALELRGDPSDYDRAQRALTQLESIAPDDMDRLFEDDSDRTGWLSAMSSSALDSLLTPGFAKKSVSLAAGAAAGASALFGTAQPARGDTLPSHVAVSPAQKLADERQPDPRISDADNAPYEEQLWPLDYLTVAERTSQKNDETQTKLSDDLSDRDNDPNKGQLTPPQTQPSTNTPTISISDIYTFPAAVQTPEGSNQGKDDQLNSELGSIASLLAVQDQLGNTTVDKASKEQASDQETTPARSEYKPLLELIGKHESANNYNAYFKDSRLGRLPNVNFTRMTVAEVMDWQRSYKARGSRSTATGYYQFLLNTLEGLVDQVDDVGPNSKFNSETQDKLAMQLLKNRGLNKYLRGEISAKEFAHRLSMEWASLPRVLGKNPNASYYAGDGLNASHVKVSVFMKAVKAIKSHKKTAATKPVNPPASASTQDLDLDLTGSDLEWNFPSATETPDEVTPSEPDPTLGIGSITDLLGETWDKTIDWFTPEEVDDVQATEPAMVLTLPQESDGGGKFKSLLAKMLGGNKAPATQSEAAESNIPRSKAVLTDHAIEMLSRGVNEETKQARLALVYTYMSMADDVPANVPRNNPVKKSDRDPQLDANLRKVGYSTSTAYDTPGYDCQITIKTAQSVSGVDKHYATEIRDGKREYMNTTRLYQWILSHEKNGISTAGDSDARYQIIHNPKQSELIASDILLAPGHTAMSLDEARYRGKTYPLAEAAKGSKRVPSFRSGQGEWNYLQGRPGALIALRVIVPDTVDLN